MYLLISVTNWNDIFAIVIQVLRDISSKLNKNDSDFNLNSSNLICLACCFSLLNWNFGGISNGDTTKFYNFSREMSNILAFNLTDIGFLNVFEKFTTIFDKNIKEDLKEDHYYKIAKRQYFEINEKLKPI